MARFRKIDPKMWVDAKFRKLDQNAKMLWIYLLTGPETTSLPGVIPAGRAQLTEALGWTFEVFDEAFRQVFEQGMAEADWDARLVYVPNAVRYNPPESPNVVVSWRDHWHTTPECELKNKALHGLQAFMQDMSEAFREAFQKAFLKSKPKTRANQEQEQEQDLYTNLAFGGEPDNHIDELFNYYIAGWKANVNGKRLPVLDAKRRKLIQARFDEGCTVDDLKRACDGLWQSEWHKQQKFWTIEAVCKSAATVEKLIAEADTSSTSWEWNVPLYEPPKETGTGVGMPKEFVEAVSNAFASKSIAAKRAARANAVKTTKRKPKSKGGSDAN
jgi:hypothetical protein